MRFLSVNTFLYTPKGLKWLRFRSKKRICARSSLTLVNGVVFTCFKFKNSKFISNIFLKTMKLEDLKKAGLIFGLLLTLTNLSDAQTARRAAAKTAKPAASIISERNVRAEMGFLASDALQGRGSGTQQEWLAGQYIGSQLQQFGVEPAGEPDAQNNPTYLQTVSITRNSFSENPKISYASKTLDYGKDFIALRVGAGQMSGSLQKITLDEKPRAGAVAFVKLQPTDDAQNVGQKLNALAGSSGAAAILVEETPQYRQRWENTAARRLSYTQISGKTETPASIFIVSKDAAEKLAQVAEGTLIEIKGQLGDAQKLQTWNAVGKITGSDPRLAAEVILLSAHMDHLGVRTNAPGDDKIFNGADDDASGCVAVLELARVLAAGAKPKRTVYFAFFGSEEAGGYGAQYYVNNLPYPKENLVANLEFEMIGRPDAKVKPEELWLTGYERSDLGAELARRGAKLVQDPHPDQNFFQRSDNYTLARQGVIAHTVSSFGLHTDYHQASDEIKTIDFSHMTRSINSMVAPVQWLVNSNFKPKWYEGKKP
jgi:Peptidase family M28